MEQKYRIQLIEQSKIEGAQPKIKEIPGEYISPMVLNYGDFLALPTQKKLLHVQGRLVDCKNDKVILQCLEIMQMDNSINYVTLSERITNKNIAKC